MSEVTINGITKFETFNVSCPYPNIATTCLCYCYFIITIINWNNDNVPMCIRLHLPK